MKKSSVIYCLERAKSDLERLLPTLRTDVARASCASKIDTIKENIHLVNQIEELG